MQLSQEQLAAKASMGRATVASIEAGRQVVALHQALALCSALGVDIGKLLVETRESNSQDHDLEGLLEPHDLQIIREIRDGLTT
jgi:transcriptional regulator with XRE-family HTH domain